MFLFFCKAESYFTPSTNSEELFFFFFLTGITTLDGYGVTLLLQVYLSQINETTLSVWKVWLLVLKYNMRKPQFSLSFPSSQLNHKLLGFFLPFLIIIEFDAFLSNYIFS